MTARPESLVGKTLAHYKILERIGAGAMGEVYRAHDSVLSRDVALKVLPSDAVSSPERQSRFEREARAVASLSHPNILQIHELRTEGDTTFMVTELLKGNTLQYHIQENTLSFREALEAGIQLAQGLAAAHKRNVVHRDLKPGNLFITHDGLLKILDFGLAKILAPMRRASAEGGSTEELFETTQGVVLGTVGYMSPEQARGKEPDTRSDIFSFGVVLYELLTRTPAFQSDSPVETLHSIIKEEPPESGSWLELPPALKSIVRRCLSKNPERRFQSASDLAYALQALVDSEIGSSSAPAGHGPIHLTHTTSQKAYDLYLKGRFHLDQRGAGLTRGLEFLRQAVTLDPEFAQAHAGAALAYTIQGFYGLTRPRDIMERAEASARRALDLDRSLGDAHAALAFKALIHDWDWRRGESEFREALKLNPDDTQTHCWFGLYWYMCVHSRVEDALKECRKAKDKDPQNFFPDASSGSILYIARRYSEAFPYFERVVNELPESFAGWRLLGLIHLAQAEHQKAHSALTRAVDLSRRHPWPLAELAIIQVAAGKPKDAQAIYQELTTRARDVWMSPVCLALTSMALGETDRAFAHLETAFLERDPMLIGFKEWPLLDPLRKDPRFPALLRRIGFEVPPDSPLRPESTPTVPAHEDKKAIAVLPFENLGPPVDDYFADGITEELISRLAEVRDLRVISRTSAVQYDQSGKTIREIGRDLGVGYVLEGTVRWDQANHRVRITPQLIRVSDDTHVWAERYDRVLDDIFALQSEIGEKVIHHLEASLLEPSAAKTAPTENMEAYQAYLRGLSHSSDVTITFESLDLAISMFQRALELDPQFVQAQARLALDHSSLYIFGYDQSPERIELTRAAAARVRELAPGTYYDHLCQGMYLYRCEKDNQGALREFEAAARRRPNDATLTASMSYIQRRQANWESSIANLKKSIEMDPQNAVRWGQLGISLSLTREYEEADRAFVRSINLAPDQLDSYLERVKNLWLWEGLLERSGEVLAQIPAQNHPRTILHWYLQDYYRREWDQALWRLEQTDADLLIDQDEYYPKPLLEFWCYTKLGNASRAQEYAQRALSVLTSEVKEHPSDPRIRCALALLLAETAREEDAVKEIGKALELVPLEKDALVGNTIQQFEAMVYGRAGLADIAVPKLKALVSSPGELSHAMLKMDPTWDSIREDTGFQHLVDS